ncbi:MAG: peptidylprolyl isomerase [Alphaproteobacteria bacterium]|jgi:peptidyl-prolyl cis-trans isomerase C|nr:peptidylprolyl isomerase [Rhodospirillaceae bacterium]MBT7613289.1 peptidylprolyl isomerase [Rhodospirillaceae bacterium]MBT7647685.1 peptidylprolyl isomerase [Rhodospirillaceae bacterium]MDG2480122.1 peptidylprolyl isomerase [Alphaproteobacteria bacterium]
MKRVLAAGAAALVLALSPLALAQSENDVVAVVNGKEITRDDIVAYILLLPAEYQEVPIEELWEPVLERVINQELIVVAAREEGLHESEEFLTQMAALESDILQQLYMQQKVDERLTVEAVEEEFQIWLDEFDERGLGDDVHARHILVATQEEAQAISERAQAGEDFATLAMELSTGPSGVDGGDLGWFRYEDMVPEFADGAFALETGAVSGPVESPFGWHVIKLEERRAAEAPVLSDVEVELRDIMARQAVMDTLDQLHADAEIEIMLPTSVIE